MKRRELAGFYLLLALIAVPALLVVLLINWLQSLGVPQWVAVTVYLLTCPLIAVVAGVVAGGVIHRIETWWRNR